MAAGTEPPTGPPTLEARLGLLDATTLVAGSMIGSGIFIVSADIARRLPAPGWLLAVWAIAGALTVAGAPPHRAPPPALPRPRGAVACPAQPVGAPLGLPHRLGARGRLHPR